LVEPVETYRCAGDDFETLAELALNQRNTSYFDTLAELALNQRNTSSIE